MKIKVIDFFKTKTFNAAVACAEKADAADAIVKRHDYDVTVSRQCSTVIDIECAAARHEATAIDPHLKRSDVTKNNEVTSFVTY